MSYLEIRVKCRQPPLILTHVPLLGCGAPFDGLFCDDLQTPEDGHLLSSIADRSTTCLFFVQVNLIPVIAKADTMTVGECKDFKVAVQSQLIKEGIRVYDFPLASLPTSSGNSDGANRVAEVKRFRQRQPFAVCTSCSHVTKEDGSKVGFHLHISCLEQSLLPRRPLPAIVLDSSLAKTPNTACMRERGRGICILFEKPCSINPSSCLLVTNVISLFFVF